MGVPRSHGISASWCPWRAEGTFTSRRTTCPSPRPVFLIGAFTSRDLRLRGDHLSHSLKSITP
jgi:hypothetical protein